MIIAARASIVAKGAQQMQTAMFCQPAQESRVVRSMRQWHLSSLSTWPTQTMTTTCKQQPSNNKKQSHRDTYPTRQACNNRWTSSELSCLAELVIPSSMTKEHAQATTTKIPCCWYSENKVDACCLMLWPGHSNFKSSPKGKNNFGWLPMARMPSLVARLMNLA